MERGVRGVTPRLKEKIPLSPTARPRGPQDPTHPVDRTRIADLASTTLLEDGHFLLSIGGHFTLRASASHIFPTICNDNRGRRIAGGCSEKNRRIPLTQAALSSLLEKRALCPYSFQVG